MTYLLDTCILSLFARGDPGVLARVKNTPPEKVFLSVVTLMEIDYGLALHPERAQRLRPVLDAFIGAVTVLDYDRASAKATASIRAALRARGTPVGPYDALLGGVAVAHGLIMVTANRSEFSRIEGLVVEDWT